MYWSRRPFIEKLGGSLDFAFEDLAGGTLGESVDKPQKSRVLVGGNPGLDVVAELVLSRVGTGA